MVSNWGHVLASELEGCFQALLLLRGHFRSAYLDCCGTKTAAVVLWDVGSMFVSTPQRLAKGTQRRFGTLKRGTTAVLHAGSMACTA